MFVNRYHSYIHYIRHIVKDKLDWICKTWTGFVKHGFVKGGFVKHVFVKHRFVKGRIVKHGFVKGGFVKHGLLLPIHTLKIIRVYFLFCDVLHAFSRVHWITLFTFLRI